MKWLEWSYSERNKDLVAEDYKNQMNIKIKQEKYEMKLQEDEKINFRKKVIIIPYLLIPLHR